MARSAEARLGAPRVAVALSDLPAWAGDVLAAADAANLVANPLCVPLCGGAASVAGAQVQRVGLSCKLDESAAVCSGCSCWLCTCACSLPCCRSSGRCSTVLRWGGEYRCKLAPAAPGPPASPSCCRPCCCSCVGASSRLLKAGALASANGEVASGSRASPDRESTRTIAPALQLQVGAAVLLLGLVFLLDGPCCRCTCCCCCCTCPAVCSSALRR